MAAKGYPAFRPIPAALHDKSIKESLDMKRALFPVLTVIVLVGLTGCQHFGRRPAACSDGCSAQAPECCQNADASCSRACDDPSADPCQKPHCRFFNGLFCKDKPERAVPEEAAPEQPSAPPQTGAIAYPYYTTRGPRDFLAKNPGSIGP
jgi:hypothetical protein